MPAVNVWRGRGTPARHLQEHTMTDKPDATSAPVTQPRTKPTGQKRSLERGKATHKKNPGKRAKHGG